MHQQDIQTAITDLSAVARSLLLSDTRDGNDTSANNVNDTQMPAPEATVHGDAYTPQAPTTSMTPRCPRPMVATHR
ncbi:hypothetical protein EYB53_021100 [Candidatus Chloroploca sp. M-50]|uniref:Uncharacterized protein n=1 Tax=Candidatus Chloroploca mongolica TaxID=2528176 RepID=A0ABS4DFL8_9CHLR|nr:hypothetical protein [Candidatus Chloroploca mongolica]MBP1468222.1 hypothetical protein [Candidatus Chloroploca mongolica]